MGKGAGWLLLVVGLALAGFGLAQAVMGSSAGPVPPALAKGGSLALGFVLVVFALILLFQTPHTVPVATPPAAAPEPEVVEIKRTDMTFDSRAEAGESDALADVRARMARLKVQYGLGEVGNESFKRQMAQLEAEEAGLEDARRG